MDFDIFFYYGQNPLDVETKADIMELLVQAKRRLFYSRSRGAAGIERYENTPSGVSLQARLPADVVTAIAERNLRVSSGEKGSRDRRVAVSQTQVDVVSDTVTGVATVSVLYIPLANIDETQTVSAPIGG